jgi:hypothetical protein
MLNRVLETEKYLLFPVYWCFVLSLPPGRGGRLGDEVSSPTQAIQSIADKMPAHDWSRYVTNQSDTSYTEYC